MTNRDRRVGRWDSLKNIVNVVLTALYFHSCNMKLSGILDTSFLETNKVHYLISVVAIGRDF